MKNAWNRLYRVPPDAAKLGSTVDVTRMLGPTITPKCSLQRAYLSTAADGGRITLSEGIYELRGTLTITRQNFSIVSTSPGKTIIRRSASTSGAMIEVTETATGFRLVGVSLQDISATNTDPTILIKAESSVVKDCHFLDYDTGILVDATAGVKIFCNRFDQSTGRAAYCVYLRDADDVIVSMNDVHHADVANPAIYADDNSERVSAVGNTTPGANMISYKALKECADAGNTPPTSIQVRP
tara:strand:- start:3071 stop:3793 length:723 start_codon:yes stop_codon:yes gene_type:complete